MSCDLEVARPDGPLFRLGRLPDAWAWPDWAYAGEDGTFGNRFDDPVGEYRVLYASTQRLGAFLETLARFRPDPAIVAEQVSGDPRDQAFGTGPAGVVPARWLESRVLGVARCDTAFADIGHARSLAALREALAASVVRHGLDDLDAAAIRLHAPRRFTQEISRHVYECTAADGSRAFQGIHYLSRLGDDIGNWAICEPALIEALDREDLRRDDPDLTRALELFGLLLA
jgi:hypothetical protein